MKRAYGVVGVGFIVLCVLVIQGCVARETYPPPSGQAFHHGHLRVVDLTIVPDPVIQGQMIRFSISMVNDSSYSRRVNIEIRDDDDELVSKASDTRIRPGTNRIKFSHTGYRFRRQDHCFVVLVDIEGNNRPVDLARRFCAQRTPQGWTLSGY
jgi:hypothetical protein